MKLDQKCLDKEEKLDEQTGSTGTIFKAEFTDAGDNDKKKDVYVKVITLSSTDKDKPNEVKVREIQNMCKCNNHANIIGFHGWIESPDTIKLIIENAKGGDLRGYQKDHLSIKQKVKVLLDAAHGLRYIHKHKIIHRDIKPENIALDKEVKDKDDLSFTAKILDLGVARTSDMSSGATTHVSGTMNYNAPEQSGGQPYDEKVDIWAFAVMAYEMFTEITAYSSKKLEKVNDTRRKSMIAKTLRPDTYDKCTRDDVPKELIETICTKNWSKEPKDRMDSEELVKVLEEIFKSMK